MGVLIDLHEVSEFKDMPTLRLGWQYNFFRSYGRKRDCHKIAVELYYRKVTGYEAPVQAKA